MLSAEQIEILRIESTKAREYSYSPYSKFRVGAAILCESGKIYTGCNVENASYGGTICAERTAIVKAISSGSSDILACGVVTDKNDTISPCGFCRQFLVEFGKEIIVVMFSNSGEYQEMKLKELLPKSFGPSDL